MARIDTLANFLTDVAAAIKEKEGTTENIPASEFDTRIANLSGGDIIVSHKELEYIGITGKTYYEVKTKLTSNSRVIAKFTRDLSATTGLFGECNYTTGTKDSFAIYMGASSYNNARIHCEYGSGSNDDKYFSTYATEIILDANKNQWTFTDFNGNAINSFSFSTKTFSSNYNCTVGASIWSGGKLYYKGNLYYLKIYEGMTLMHDLIPVKMSNGTVTLYDKVNDTYLTNLGDTEPTPGPEIPEQSESPKILSELENQIVAITQKHIDYMFNDYVNNFAAYTDEPVTLYTPNEKYKHYMIRARDSGASTFGIIWSQKRFQRLAASGGMVAPAYIRSADFEQLEPTPVNNGFLSYYPMSSDTGYTSQTYNSFEECLAAIQDPNTVYTYNGSVSSWSTYTHDGYKISCSNIPCVDSTIYDELYPGRRISSNETIEVIPTTE